MLFVGEKRSDLAIKMGVTWEDGRLAAKQLFDALRYCGIDPKDHEYCNWFEDGGENKVKSYQGSIIAMGNKVSKAMRRDKIKHFFIYHPATRGKLRKKEMYFMHVQTTLKNISSTTF